MQTNNKRISEIEFILRKETGISGWQISKPEQGLSKETYIAKSDKRIVFVKFDVNIPPLKRLSKLGLTPKVIATGVVHNENFVIQEFIEGIHPNRLWFESHIAQLARFIKIYHYDKQLIKLLAGNRKFRIQKQIKDDFRNIEEQIDEVALNQYETEIFKNSFNLLKKQGRDFSSINPAVIHADPNLNNILVASDKIYMIDWDNVILSDPLRDIGLILWWYVPKAKWKTFFKYYGLDVNESVYNRLYFWVALRSLVISLWFIINKNDTKAAKEYLRDFYTAVNKQDNPRSI